MERFPKMSKTIKICSITTHFDNRTLNGGQILYQDTLGEKERKTFTYLTRIFELKT